jgi:hypothetical protein
MELNRSNAIRKHSDIGAPALPEAGGCTRSPGRGNLRRGAEVTNIAQ